MDDGPDLKRHRRFVLVIGLVLITSQLAGLKVGSGEIRPLGLPFTIDRPQLVIGGLWLASLYGMLSFLYYGAMLTRTPGWRRSRAREILTKGEFHLGSKEEMSEAEAHHRAKTLTEEMRSLFPRVFGKELRVEWKSIQTHAEGVTVEFHRPNEEPTSVRFACGLQTADYWAPVWVNGFALLSPLWAPFVARMIEGWSVTKPMTEIAPRILSPF